MAKVKKSKVKRRMKWGLIKIGVKLAFVGGGVAGVTAAAKKTQVLLGGLTGK